MIDGPSASLTPSSLDENYPDIGLDLAQRGGEGKILRQIRNGDTGIYRASYNGNPCYVRRFDYGNQPAVGVLVQAGTDGSPERGHWEVFSLIQDDERRNARSHQDRFKESLADVLKAIQENERSQKLVVKDSLENVGEHIAELLRDNLGEENIYVEQVHSVFIILVEGDIRFNYDPGILFRALHQNFENIAEGVVEAEFNTADDFTAEYNGVPFRETGYLLYLLGVRHLPQGRRTHGRVEIDIAYDPSEGAFDVFEIKILF